MSRELAVLILIVLVLINAAAAVVMFGLGLWPVALLNTASGLYSLITVIRIA